MKTLFVGLALPVAALCLAVAAPALSQTAASFAAAVADKDRPAKDKFRDGRRKPAETLAFAGVKPGMKVAELIPGNGYYSRLLSRAVGPGGHLYTIPFGEPRASFSKALAEDPAYKNITLTAGSMTTGVAIPEPVDLVWTSQNYHDIRAGRSLFNRAIYAALKPGGTYFIVDHAAKAGAGAGDEVLLSLHRIDEEVVKREVLAAGFVLDGEGQFLRNPKDDRSKLVVDRELDRATDQFVLRFKKPR